ncbi:MAG: ATP-binding protein [Bacillota bacterium]
MSKLAKKLAIIMVLLSVGGLLFISIYLNYSLKENFNDYLYEEKVERIEEFADLLEKRYEAGESWTNIEKIMDELKSLNNFNIIITDTEKNMIIANSQWQNNNMGSKQIGRNNKHSNMNSSPNDIESYNKIILNNNNNNEFAFLYWALPQQQSLQSEQGEIFVSEMNKIILYTALIIILITIFISLIFSKYITIPILKMNKFANKVAKGNFNNRLNIRANDELTQLGNSLNEMTKKLDHLNKIRKKSTSDLAHELRTPLTSIKSYIEGIEDGVIKADKNNISDINEELEKLIKLVERLAHLNEAERKKVYMKKEKIEINNMLNNLIKRFNNRKIEKNIEIINNVSKNKLWVFADEESLEIIFRNLISNAIKYNVEDGFIKIITKKENDFALIQIEDSGIGIKEKDLEFIFERFYRGDSSRSKEIKGTGVGLAVVRELIEALDGEIKVSSSKKGSIFSIYLPLIK